MKKEMELHFVILPTRLAKFNDAYLKAKDGEAKLTLICKDEGNCLSELDVIKATYTTGDSVLLLGRWNNGYYKGKKHRIGAFVKTTFD